MTHFDSEKDLVLCFRDHLKRADVPWSFIGCEVEFDYTRGKADLVALSHELDLTAFEAKLLRWRDALYQAYRNRCFAHRSFVVLPPEVAIRASRYEAEFERRGVGLCSVDREGIVIFIDSERDEPVEPWLSSRATAHVTGERNGNPEADSRRASLLRC
jgi:hypothetical protein